MKKIFLAVGFSFFLAACGGGGGGSNTNSNVDTAAPLVTGQVVKGLTSGALVRLSLVANEGTKSPLATVLSDQNGSFSFPVNLQAGMVYLVEASGGQFVNEITDLRESLSAPLRAVFVARGPGQRIVLSPISEMTVAQVERTTTKLPWSADFVDSANAKSNAVAGVSSNYDFDFVDLTKASPGSNPGATNADIGSSFMVGWFAGFYQDLRLKDTATTLATALDKYYGITLGSSDDDSVQSSMFGGLVRLVEKSPVLSSSKATLYASLGMPSDTSSNDFLGIEATGSSSVTIPNGRLRFLNDANIPSNSNTNTVFNQRGALVAYEPGNGPANMSSIGYSSAAEVYGTEETAIGRWNHGLYYPNGVSYNASNKQFVTTNAKLAKLSDDMVYAAAVPAYNLPTCATVVMSLKATTAPHTWSGAARKYTIDPSSKISAYFINGKTYVGYSIAFSGDGYARIRSPGGVEAPWASEPLSSNQEFRIPTDFQAPGGDFINFSGLLAGNGGTQAVVKISPARRWIGGPNGIAAAFSQDGPVQTCQPTTFAIGSLSAVPATGSYQGQFTYFFGNPALEFSASGAPKILALSPGQNYDDLVAERSGNNQVGIGVFLPPYSTGGSEYTVPQSYVYASAPGNPNYPQTGVVTYRLIASTPYLLTNTGSLVSAVRISTASLEVDAAGTASSNFYLGRCRLTVNGVSTPNLATDYFRSSGNCGVAMTSFERYLGALSPDGGRYAVVKYTYSANNLANAEISLLFERNP